MFCMEDYKQKTKDLYDEYAKNFQKRTEGYLKKYLLKDANLFIQSLNGVDVLDIGSGPGRDSSYFKKRGLNPLCVDISQTMIDICRERGLQAKVMDIENLKFPDSSFGGVWAHTSLLHVPKRNFGSVLKKISSILKEEGIFYIGMKEGNYDGMEEDLKYKGKQRYNALYTEDEVKREIEKHFVIIHYSKIEIDGSRTYFNYLCRKK